jgi:hypothetical protein
MFLLVVGREKNDSVILFWVSVVGWAARSMSNQDTFMNMLAGKFVGCFLSFGDCDTFASLAH